jgi:hypothetical protein
MSCGHCSRVIAVKVNRRRNPQEVLIPGLCIGAIPFTDGIDNLGDLVVHAGDLMADAVGLVADFLG